MTPSFETPRQREDIARKYDNYYGFLALLARYVVLANDASNAEKYAILKKVLPALWAEFAARGQSDPRTWEQFVATAEEFNARPTTWFEDGVKSTGVTGEREFVLKRKIPEAAKKYFQGDEELILDLGCGWGHRMFDMWLAGVAPSALFMGGDRSDHSRDLVQDVGSLFPDMHTAWFRFDFAAPDFSAIFGYPRRIGVFTCHAIEQVSLVGTALFGQLLKRFPEAEITGIHFEPMTFQFGNDYISPPYADVERDLKYAKKNGYNLDLYAQVRNHPALSIIAVEQAVLDGGGGNSTSLLVWRKR